MKGAGRKWKTERLDELKETLEEAAQRMSIGIREEDYKDGFIDGAKYMAERMYSEEEVLNILHLYSNHFEIYTTPKFSNNMFFDMFFEWFKQFEKK